MFSIYIRLQTLNMQIEYLLASRTLRNAQSRGEIYINFCAIHIRHLHKPKKKKFKINLNSSQDEKWNFFHIQKGSSHQNLLIYPQRTHHSPSVRDILTCTLPLIIFSISLSANVATLIISNEYSVDVGINQGVYYER